MNKVLIIAEAGVNHNGSLKIAKKLIDIASKAKADVVKFQIFNPDELATPYAQKAPYQKKHYLKNKSQLHMLKKLELNKSDHIKLIDYCKKKKILYMASVFDLPSLNFIKNKIKIIKIPSGEITNIPLLKAIGRSKKKVIISTGASNLNEIKNAVKTLTNSGLKKKQISILHCNSEYPTTNPKDINLKVIKTLKKIFSLIIGYSDHTLGIEIPIASVVMGAKIIEKHFTINKKLNGPDHSSSLSPTELRLMVKAIRKVENAIGNGIKKATYSERKNINIIRKSIVAQKFIKKGDLFNAANITTKRPAKGIKASEWDKVIGKKAKRNFKKNQFISI